jgi:hypothetical protein
MRATTTTVVYGTYIRILARAPGRAGKRVRGSDGQRGKQVWLVVMVAARGVRAGMVRAIQQYCEMCGDRAGERGDGQREGAARDSVQRLDVVCRGASGRV